MTSLLDYNVALFLFVTLSLWPEINAIIIFGSTVIANFVFKSLNGNPETGKKNCLAPEQNMVTETIHCCKMRH